MELYKKRRISLSTGLGINLLAGFVGVFATIRLVLRIWDFLWGFYDIPIGGFSLFLEVAKLRFFFIIGFSAAGMLIGVVTGLIQWWMLRISYTLSLRWVLISTICWAAGLVISYSGFAILYDILWRTSVIPFASSIASSMYYMSLSLFFLIYFVGGIIASIGEWFILKIGEIKEENRHEI